MSKNTKEVFSLIILAVILPVTLLLLIYFLFNSVVVGIYDELTQAESDCLNTHLKKLRDRLIVASANQKIQLPEKVGIISCYSRIDDALNTKKLEPICKMIDNENVFSLIDKIIKNLGSNQEHVFLIMELKDIKKTLTTQKDKVNNLRRRYNQLRYFHTPPRKDIF